MDGAPSFSGRCTETGKSFRIVLVRALLLALSEGPISLTTALEAAR
jgi:hypothetical protein